jgi:glycosyltransferase involved in cell wall biosynthesis
MRVAFVVPGGLDRVSGGFIYDRHLIAALRARGAVVDVVPLPWLPWAAAVVAGAALWPRTARALRGYDVVIEDELGHPSVVARPRGWRANGPRVIALVHNLACRQPATRQRWARTALERAYLRGVDGVAAVCASTRADVEQLVCGAAPSVIARAGRDHLAAMEAAAVIARAPEPGPLRVLFAGTVTPAKGLHRLVDTLAELVRDGDDVTVDVAGAEDPAGVYPRALRDRVAAQGLQPRVRWHGLLRGDALWALYRRCHVLALPSDREAYPLVAIEALAFGLPVLATDQGGVRELLDFGAHAHVLPPDDRGAWRRALASFAADRATLAAASQAALARFVALGTWADAADTVLSLCDRLGVR